MVPLDEEIHKSSSTNLYMTGHCEFGFEEVVDLNRRQFVNFVMMSGLSKFSDFDTELEVILLSRKEADLGDVGDGAWIVIS